jgi:hypothetical protein
MAAVRWYGALSGCVWWCRGAADTDPVHDTLSGCHGRAGPSPLLGPGQAAAAPPPTPPPHACTMVMIGRLERVLGGLLYVAVQHYACEHTPAPHATLTRTYSYFRWVSPLHEAKPGGPNLPAQHGPGDV